MRLNGWQRIGIVLSVGWVVFGFIWGHERYASDQSSAALNYKWMCESPLNDEAQASWLAARKSGAPITAQQAMEPYASQYAQCQHEYDTEMTAILGRDQYLYGLGVAFVPSILAWILAWFSVRIFRWVRVGFASPRV